MLIALYNEYWYEVFGCLVIFTPPNSKKDLRKSRKFINNEDNELYVINQLFSIISKVEIEFQENINQK